MTAPSFRVRRATLDDIGQLNALWASLHLDVADLGRRITEFQVAEDGAGKVIGGVALQIADRQGRIHSDGFTDFALADQVRPLLWDRIQSVATNHGLLRLWCQENIPFWNRIGLAKADEEALTKLPAAWRGLNNNAPWLTLKLKDELETLVSADKEFAVFMEAERERTKRTLQHAKLLKIVASIIAFGILIVVLVAAFMFIKKSPQMRRRGDLSHPGHVQRA